MSVTQPRFALLMSAALISAAVSGAGGHGGYITPDYTFSPDQHYGVMVPVLIDVTDMSDDRMNQVVELRTHRVVAIIHADAGYDRALNYHETVPPRWSSDSSLLLWKVDGKWNPDVLVVLKIGRGKPKWELDLLKTAQQAVLSRTKKAAPERYAMCKKATAGNGSAFPDGFTVDVTTDREDTKTVSFPLGVHADLSSNPKEIDGFPTLTSHLDAVVTAEGEFIVKEFHLGSTKRAER
jgi:hypothetical protein